eukprot:5726493-Prorocentrum_lima.AAC.1
MTSSLVGSEMCIRDRFLVATSPSRSELSSPGHQPPPARPTIHLLCLQIPVSYTHLTLPTICSV